MTPGTRFALVTATLPEPVWLDLQALFPDIRMAKCAPLSAPQWHVLAAMNRRSWHSPLVHLAGDVT